LRIDLTDSQKTEKGKTLRRTIELKDRAEVRKGGGV